MAFKLLFIGDVVGRPGRRVLANRLSGLCSRLDVDLVVANGENAAGGAGITPSTARELYDAGVDVICLLYTSPSPRDLSTSRMPSSA